MRSNDLPLLALAGIFIVLASGCQHRNVTLDEFRGMLSADDNNSRTRKYVTCTGVDADRYLFAVTYGMIDFERVAVHRDEVRIELDSRVLSGDELARMIERSEFVPVRSVLGSPGNIATVPSKATADRLKSEGWTVIRVAPGPNRESTIYWVTDPDETGIDLLRASGAITSRKPNR